MSQHQEVRVLMRTIWSALPLFGSGTKTRIRVPAVIPKTGDTYRGTRKDPVRPLDTSHDMLFRMGGVWERCRTKAVCLQSESEWTAAEFADTPDILHKPTGAENIPFAYSM